VSKPPALTICVDTREGNVPPFPEGVTLLRETMKTADYTSPALRTVAVVERKSVSDFCSTISFGRERFERELERMRSFRFKACVVEGDCSLVMRSSGVHPHAILGTVASMTARWDCPVLFVPNEASCGRIIAGLLARWEKRLREEADAKLNADLTAELAASLADVPSVPQADPFEELEMLARAEEELP
jgi:ERCC4-type nuclease